MSPPYDRYERSRRGVWSHWVPLAVTLTVATVGVAAWAWSQRKDDDEQHGQQQPEEHEQDLDYENADYGENPPYGASGRDRDSQQHPRPGRDFAPGETTAQTHNELDTGWGSRMSGALRRTPSPQQFFDSTGKTVVAGFAAAGAAMGKALSSIREEDRAYGGTNPWSEEADAKQDRGLGASSQRRKTVAVVVSADTDMAGFDDDEYLEHASILSHIPKHTDFSTVKLFVLIYAPSLKDTTLDTSASNMAPQSLSSSFSNIGHDQAQSVAEGAKGPSSGVTTTNAAFNAIHSQAMALVDKEAMILPYTSANGHAHILRHLQPDVLYLQESLAGEDGSIIVNLQTWMRHDVMLVVGAETGSGGLADSESEAEKPTSVGKWWQKTERVGRGRGVIVVDSTRLHDDWSRRVQGME